ncbi:MAG: pyridoxal-phosphate dependent enzyme [Planctomycetaceae bacterium]
MKQPAIDLNDVRLASERIRPWIRNTPVLSSESLDQDLGCHVHFKCENLQHIGAFKARGACNAVLNLSDHAAASGVLTHSSGNHAAALARAARIRGIEAHIVMPVNSAEVKLAAVRRLGVTPILCEPTAEAREIRAAELLKKTGATLIHPFDNPDVIAGQGTVALELLSQLNHIDAVICPVGGGGLLSGTLTVIKTLRPDVAVYAAEPEWANDCARGMKSGRIELNDRFDARLPTDCERASAVNLTFPIIHSLRSMMSF